MAGLANHLLKRRMILATSVVGHLAEISLQANVRFARRQKRPFHNRSFRESDTRHEFDAIERQASILAHGQYQ
jgi:hypothetical protein